MAPPPSVPVPLCDIQGQYRELQADLDAAVARVLSSGQVILGPEVTALEQEVAAYCGVGHGVGCGSGTDALLLALHALGIGPGDEVVVPPFTFFASVGAICRTGATPVFADIDPVTYNLDPLQAESKITSRTRAIMPVHLFGQCADMEGMWRLADRHGLLLVEDAAQALGSEFRGKKAGSLGSIGCLSFYPSKNLGAFGDAGMVVTNDPAWARKMSRLRVHGMEPKYHHPELGWNARIDALQAAMLRVKLPHLERWLGERQEAARCYDALIEDHRLSPFLSRPAVAEQCRHTFNQYVVRVPRGERDGLLGHLKSEQIGCEVYYPIPLHLQECLSYLGYQEGDFPVSEEACRCVLALPIFPGIRPEQQERVIQSCSRYLRMRGRRAA